MDEKFITRNEHEEYVKRMEDEHRRQNKRINELEGQNDVIQELALSVQKLAMNIENMVEKQNGYANTQNRIFERLEALESKPAKRWDTLVVTVITAIASGFVGYILSMFF